MSSLQIIEQREVFGRDFKIYCNYGDYENPLFLAKDVAEWIEHNKPSEMLTNIDEDERLKAIITHSGQKREMWFLTEDGLYEVLMQSRKPIAKAFKKEVKKILKEIRLTGQYNTTKHTKGYYLNGTEVFTRKQIAEELGIEIGSIRYWENKLKLKYGIDYIDLYNANLRKFKNENPNFSRTENKIQLRIYTKQAKGLLVGDRDYNEKYSQAVLDFVKNSEKLAIQ